MIKIKKSEEHTSVSEICKLLQKSDRKFLQDNAFAKQIVKERTSVRVRN